MKRLLITSIVLIALILVPALSTGGPATQGNRAMMPGQLHGARYITADYQPGRDSVPRVNYQMADAGNDEAANNDPAVSLQDARTVLESRQYTPGFWQGLKRVSITKLQVSLNPAQLDRTDRVAGKLKDFLKNARANDISVELLSGDQFSITPVYGYEQGRPSRIL